MDIEDEASKTSGNGAALFVIDDPEEALSSLLIRLPVLSYNTGT